MTTSNIQETKLWNLNQSKVKGARHICPTNSIICINTRRKNMFTDLLSTALALILVGIVFAITWHNIISITAKKE